MNVGHVCTQVVCKANLGFWKCQKGMPVTHTHTHTHLPWQWNKAKCYHIVMGFPTVQHYGTHWTFNGAA